MEKPIIILSGGFDPYHDGHAEMFREANKIGKIWVILNSDAWLIKKKGNIFMHEHQRKGVIETIKGVVNVTISSSLSDVSKDIWRIYTTHISRTEGLMLFANGGDRTADNTPEQEVCQKLGIPVIFGLGGGKSNSSSDLLNRWIRLHVTEEQLDDLTDISAVCEIDKG